MSLNSPQCSHALIQHCHHQGNGSSQPLLSKWEPSFFSLGVIFLDLSTLIETRELEYSTVT